MTKLARLFHNADDVVDAWRDALKHRDVKGALDIWLDDDSITCVQIGRASCRERVSSPV